MPRPALLLGLLLVAGCVGGPAPDLRRERLVGIWTYRYSAEEGQVYDVWVDDSTFVVDTPADTIYRYWYRIADGALSFDDGQGTVTRVDVVKLTAGSLVLRGVPFTGPRGTFRMARDGPP
ncbi:MAG TPA: hypothetical protein VK610_03225 [Rhodothermales bacterium]|nr:hypothetical protein [Rhodothermales bacterium]